jgi:hypothetical protein
MHMRCSACSKVTFILILKHMVVSKTKKNKFGIDEPIGSLIDTKLVEHRT